MTGCDREEKPQKPIISRVPAMLEDDAPGSSGNERRRTKGTRKTDTQKEVAEAAAQKAAAAAIHTLVAGFDQFEIDYDRMPMPTSSVKGTDCDVDTRAEEGLATILKGLDNEQNPREKDYLGELPQAAVENEKVGGGWHPETPEALAIYDPWGFAYRVMIDLDEDGQLEDPETWSKPTEERGKQAKIQQRVLVWSPGRDGDPETWGDNICSWK